MDFAGGYPVLILWGILPPVMNLILRHRMKSNDESNLQTAGPSAWVALMGLISLILFLMNTFQDVIHFIKR